jgi:hypothetical protein
MKLHPWLHACRAYVCADVSCSKVTGDWKCFGAFVYDHVSGSLKTIALMYCKFEDESIWDWFWSIVKETCRKQGVEVNPHGEYLLYCIKF